MKSSEKPARRKFTPEFKDQAVKRVLSGHDRCQPLQSASACGGCEGRKSGDESHQRGLNTKIH